MTSSAERDQQQRAAKIAGAIYLVAMALSIYVETAIRGTLYVTGDAPKTAANILAAEGLFRVGIALDLAVYVGSLVLAWAFFTLLAPVNRLWALLGVWLRLVEVSLCAVAVLFLLVALHLLGGGPHLAAFTPEQVHGLMRVALVSHSQALNLGFVFLGLGSTVFAVLLYRARYVPRAIAGLGIVASVLLALYPMVAIVQPAVRPFWMAAMAPMFLYEVALGSWFLVKGVDLDQAAA